MWGVKMYGSVALLTAMAAPSLAASMLDECDFRNRVSTCTASLSVNRDNNTYDVGAVDPCSRVTVDIDGTPYVHSFQNGGSEVANVMVFDKSKPYDVTIRSCEVFKTKRQEVADCTPTVQQAAAGCPAQFNAEHDRCQAELDNGTTTVEQCQSAIHGLIQSCYTTAADAGNNCLNAHYFGFGHGSWGTGVTTGQGW